MLEEIWVEMVESGQSAAVDTGTLVEQGRPQASMADRLSVLAAHLAESPVECPLTHHFAHGVYGREMLIPAGTAVIGKVHKFSNMLIMASGRAHILLGDKPAVIRAPYIWVSPPGTQRAVCAITDCVFIAVHGTDKTDLGEIEAEFIAQDMLAYEQHRLLIAAQGE